MELHLQIKMNDRLYLRDPESSELGKRIINCSVQLISELGFEDFTFKKLAALVKTTEASVYRYFENKHRLLVYIITWYWRWIEYQVVFQTNNVKDPKKRLEIVIQILLFEFDDAIDTFHNIDKTKLRQIVIAESAKSYLTKNVASDNKSQLFKPYKDLCAHIAAVVKEYNPNCKFSRSISSTVIEMAHFQLFFKHNLPSLTDFSNKNDDKEVFVFLKMLLFSFIDQ
jgi:AcrR family transcriptional regulator